MDDVIDCDKEIDTLLEIYHRASMEEKAMQRRQSNNNYNQCPRNFRGIDITQLPVPQRFVKKQKKASTRQETKPLPAFSIDCSTLVPIKDSYDAVLATLMDLNNT